MQSRKRELGFELDATGPKHLHIFGSVCGVCQECRLPDAGLTADDERSAAPFTDVLQEVIDLLALVIPSNEHRADRS